MDYQQFVLCLVLCRRIKIVQKAHSSNPVLSSTLCQIHDILYNYVSHNYKPVAAFLSSDNLSDEFNSKFATIYNPGCYKKHIKGSDPTPIKLERKKNG